MGALAANYSWTTEDDIKLRKAAEAGVSLESLARGVVQFSRRFTIQEVQDRWHAILYDPAVSAEASARMLEFEHSASAPFSKSARMLEFEHSASAPFSKSAPLDNIKENILVIGKRKAESVRRRFYAMRKRMRDHPLNSLDLSFCSATINSNGNGNEGHPPAGELVQNNQAAGFSTYEAAAHADFSLDVNQSTLHCEHQNYIEDNNYLELHDGGMVVAHTSQDNASPLTNDATVEEYDGFEEIDNLLESEEKEFPDIIDQPHINEMNEYHVIRGDKNLHLALPNSQAAIQNSGSSSTLQQMPVWSTEDPCSSTSHSIQVKEEQRAMARPPDFSGDVYLGAAKLENQVCGETTTAVTNANSYLMEISNTLFNMEDDLPLIDADGNVIDKSYIDGLTSRLLESPKRDALHDIIDPVMPILDEFQVDHDAFCSGQFGNCSQPLCGIQETKSLEGLSLPSSSGMNSKSLDSPIICPLNTEDPDIPSNDDVFLLPLAPFTSPYVTQTNIFQPAPRPSSKSTRDSAVGWKRDSKHLISEDIRYEQPQFSSPIIGSQLRSEIQGDNRVEQDLSSSDGEHVVHGKSSLPCEDRSQVCQAIISRSNLFSASEKAVAIRSEKEVHHCSSVNTVSESKTGGSDIFPNGPHLNAIVGNHDMHTLATSQQEVLPAEVVSTEATNPLLVARHSPTDEEALSSLSDDDIPNFSDVEAMILDEDSSPDEHNLNLNGTESSHHLQTLKYEHEEAQKRIIRWEQAADAFVKRDMTSRGAFAILQGSHMKYYIKKPEILIGRATEDVSVDMDLGRGGRNSRVSRRQAIIEMDEEGCFQMKNLGKNPIFVNSAEIGRKQSVGLTSSCLIEIRGMGFLFETNEEYIKRYVERMRMRMRCE